MKNWITCVVLAGAASVAVAQGSDAARADANELFSDAVERTNSLAAPAFAPKIGGFFVARYNINLRDNRAPVDDLTTGGQAAYTKLNVSGKVWDETISYRIQFKFGESNGQAVLDDAYGESKLDNELSVRWGQFKPALIREENVSDQAQLAANRSVMNSVFSPGRTQGVMVTYGGQDFRLSTTIGDGIQTQNLDYTAPNEADYGATVRVVYKWGGDWKQYEEFTSWQGSKHFGAFGGALHYQAGGETFAAGVPSSTTTNTDTLLGTADVMTKGDGWNAYAAVVTRSVNGPGVRTLTDHGLLVQGGWFVRPQWELFGRFDTVIPDGDRALDSTFSTLTFGASKYISPESHAVKLTLNALWFLDATSTGIVTQNTLTGLLTTTKRNEIALQAQMQIAF